MQANALQGGFSQEPQQAAEAFRAAMTAMARPGVIETVRGAEPPAPMSIAAGVLVLTLCDPETPVFLAGDWDCRDVRDWITFHTGAPFMGRSHAAFALGSWQALLPLKDYPIGTPEYPDRSTTLIVEMPELKAEGATLTGPGIKDHAGLSLPELEGFQANAALFPQGLDFFLTQGDRLAGLPRTTKVTQAGS